MCYGILWITSLACYFLIVATIASLASRCKKPFWRRFWPILAGILTFFSSAAMAGIGGYILKVNLQPKWLFWYGLSQTIVYLIGVIIILKRGLKGITSEEHRARLWPRARLAAAFGLVLFSYIVTLNFIEMRILVDLANIRTETTSRIISLLPGPLPDGFNAHLVYEETTHALGPRDDLPDWFQDSHKPDFNPTSEKVTRLLTKHKGLLSTLHRAASLPTYGLKVDVSNFYEWPIPNYLNYRAFAKLLNLAARHKALSGDPSGALRDLSMIEGMAEHLRSFPILISFMMARAVDEIRVQGLEYILAYTSDLPVSQIDLPVITHTSVLNSFLNAHRLEAQGHLQFFTKISALSDIFSGYYSTGVWPSKIWRVFFLPSDLKAAKDIIAYGMSKPAKTYEEAKKNIETITKAKESGKLGIFTAIAVPKNYSGFAIRSMIYDAQRGLSDLALAATAYKVAKGDYPAKLKDLVPKYLVKIPLDPFDDQPLKLKLIEGGLDLYSSGPSPKSKSIINKGPIHFYLGRGAYEEYRVKPAREERQKKALKKKKRKSRRK